MKKGGFGTMTKPSRDIIQAKFFKFTYLTVKQLKQVKCRSKDFSGARKLRVQISWFGINSVVQLNPPAELVLEIAHPDSKGIAPHRRQCPRAGIIVMAISLSKHGYSSGCPFKRDDFTKSPAQHILEAFLHTNAR